MLGADPGFFKGSSGKAPGPPGALQPSASKAAAVDMKAGNDEPNDFFMSRSSGQKLRASGGGLSECRLRPRVEGCATRGKAHTVLCVSSSTS